MSNSRTRIRKLARIFPNLVRKASKRALSKRAQQASPDLIKKMVPPSLREVRKKALENNSITRKDMSVIFQQFGGNLFRHSYALYYNILRLNLHLNLGRHPRDLVAKAVAQADAIAEGKIEKPEGLTLLEKITTFVTFYRDDVAQRATKQLPMEIANAAFPDSDLSPKFKTARDRLAFSVEKIIDGMNRTKSMLLDALDEAGIDPKARIFL